MQLKNHELATLHTKVALIVDEDLSVGKMVATVIRYPVFYVVYLHREGYDPLELIAHASIENGVCTMPLDPQYYLFEIPEGHHIELAESK